jgi:mono/diheme cytochrome c family protein
MVVPDSGTSLRRYGILDSPLQTAFSDGWADRGVDSWQDFDSLQARGAGWVACGQCHGADHVFEPLMVRWLLDGRVLVCLECGADLT